METGCLYIVATPIGNLADITRRAIATLRKADLIAAEDTRHSRKLLASLAINTQPIALHDHNERNRSATLIEHLRQGLHIALISDAGTPLISDPGYHLIRAAQNAGIPVTPIPGASAIVAALSASGLPANRFYCHGFLPAKTAARKTALRRLAGIPETLAFYESARRIIPCLHDINDILGGDREIVIARELTKAYETIQRDTVTVMLNNYLTGRPEQRGEFVLLVAGARKENTDADLQQVQKLLEELNNSLSAAQLASAVSKAMNIPRKQIYRMVLDIRQQNRPPSAQTGA